MMQIRCRWTKHKPLPDFKKEADTAIYEMVPCYEEAVILGDSLAESILDFRLLRKHNVVAKRNRCIDSIQGDLLFAISMQPR